MNLLMFFRQLVEVFDGHPRCSSKVCLGWEVSSLTGKSSVAKAGEVLGCGPSLLSLYTSSWTWDSARLSSGEAECGFSRFGSCFCA